MPTAILTPENYILQSPDHAGIIYSGLYVPLLLGALGVPCREGFTRQNDETSGSATMINLRPTAKITTDSTIAPNGVRQTALAVPR